MPEKSFDYSITTLNGAAIVKKTNKSMKLKS